MPSHNGIECHVRSNNANLQEWGVKKISGRNHIFCFVQSETGASFQVTVKPDLDFFGDDTPLIKRFESDRNSEYSAVPDYYLVASVYLDGKTKAERRAIVHIDRNHDDFDFATGGEVTIKARLVRCTDGVNREFTWQFSELTVDILIDGLLIDNVRYTEDEMGHIVSALDSAQLGTTEGERLREEKKALGQIVVTVERVDLGKTRKNHNYRPRHAEDEEENAKGIKTGNHVPVSHVTEYRKDKQIPKAIPTCSYTPIVEHKSSMVTFQFFYRSAEKLRRYAFPGFPLPPIILPDDTIKENRPAKKRAHPADAVESSLTAEKRMTLALRPAPGA